MENSAPLNPVRLPACFLSLFAAILFYALLGSPTPDHPGWIEALIGLLLAVSVATAGIPKGLSFLFSRNGFLKALQVLFLTGLVLPTVAGAYLGNDRMLILRDVLAFAFLALPLFLADKFKLHDRAATIFCSLLVFAGLSFCLRTLIPAFNVWIPQGELLYLSNSPLALFAAVYLAGHLWVSLESVTRMNLVHVLACLAGLGVLIAAMLLDVQRATVGAVFLTWLILAVHALIKHPRRILLPLLMIGALAAALYPVVSDAMHAMAVKTAEVGLNARVAEAKAVYNTLIAYPPSLFVGQGWGSTFSSPAVAGLSVNYTHSFLTTMALKGGLILFFLSTITVLAALYQIFLIFQRDKVRGLALFWSLTIPVFLYASHKSLDFGLLLLMIGVWSNDPGPLHKGHSSGKTEGHPEQVKLG
jgi:hypothetical protein